MTRQESFKRRIRRRMARTGERYGAARRNLIKQAERSRGRTWVSEPEVGDDRLREATGRGWDDWCDVIDAGPGRDAGHGAIAAHLVDVHGVPGWWAQTITVGYERITGIRLPYQQPDGTFSASKTKTVTVDAAMLRAILVDDADRADLFPGHDTELRSRPDAKTLRVSIGPGVAQIAVDPLATGRVRISISHDKLPSPGDVEEWKGYWGDWLDAVDAG